MTTVPAPAKPDRVAFPLRLERPTMDKVRDFAKRNNLSLNAAFAELVVWALADHEW